MSIILLILTGLVLGSFINALVWRLHEQSKPSKKLHKELSILNGRSMCPKCGHKLSVKDLVPVLSWVSLSGKCRYCKKPISAQYPVVELLTLTLFIVSYCFWPYGFNSEGVTLFIVWLVTLTGFVALTVYDIKWKLLPNKLVYPLIVLAVGQTILKLILSQHRASFLEGEAFGVFFSAGLFYMMYLVSKGQWIGGGDVKLAIVIGLLVGGPAKAIFVVFAASLIGSLISLPLLFSKKVKRDSLIAFGPFLICATYICYLFGTHIINWYQRLIVS